VLALVRALGDAGKDSGPELVQRLIAPSDWLEAIEHLPLGFRPAPFRSFLDVATRRRVADELAVFRPDLLVLWGAEAAKAVERPRGEDKAVRLGVVMSYEEVAAFAHAGARRLVAPTVDLADWAREAGWPEREVGALAPVVLEPAVAPLLRQRWDTPPEVALLAVPASDAAGSALALDALSRLPDDIWMWLVPPTAKTRRLKRRLRKLGVHGRVRLVDDPSLAAAGADLALVARVDDPIGLPVVACWAAERAVVAYAAPGPAALIRHDRDGLLIAPDDPLHLADLLARLFADPLRCDRLAAAGRAVYDRDFAANRAADRWELMLQTLAGPPKTAQRGEAGTDIRV
jgi:glycosyltransferase involved in cell wall biosynthesis